MTPPFSLTRMEILANAVCIHGAKSRSGPATPSSSQLVPTVYSGYKP